MKYKSAEQHIAKTFTAW